MVTEYFKNNWELLAFPLITNIEDLKQLLIEWIRINEWESKVRLRKHTSYGVIVIECLDIKQRQFLEVVRIAIPSSHPSLASCSIIGEYFKALLSLKESFIWAIEYLEKRLN